VLQCVAKCCSVYNTLQHFATHCNVVLCCVVLCEVYSVCSCWGVVMVVCCVVLCEDGCIGVYTYIHVYI